MVLRSIPPITSTGSERTRRPRKRPTYSKKIKPSAYKPRPFYFRGTSELQKGRGKKPREWRYITKPFFAKIKEPLVDVFKEAQEVQIIIDLGGFTKGEVSFGLVNGKYAVYGKHGEQEFKEEIDLPKGVDLDNMIESVRNNILGLVLPRKTKPTVKKRPEKIKRPKKKKPKRRK